MSDLSIVRGQRNIINLLVTMPIPGAIDWSTSWLQFDMIVPGTSPPNAVICKTTRSNPNEIELLHDDLVRITLEPGDFAQVPADVPGLDWRLKLYLGGFNAYELDEGFARFESGDSSAHE